MLPRNHGNGFGESSWFGVSSFKTNLMNFFFLAAAGGGGGGGDVVCLFITLYNRQYLKEVYNIESEVFL